MREFIKYIRLVAANYFNGVLGWGLSLIGALSLLLSFRFPALPIWVGIAILIINAFLVTFSIWRTEAKRAAASEAELKKVKDEMPEYSISVGDIKKYSIQDLLDTNSAKVAELKQKIDNVSKPEPADNSSVVTGSFSASLGRSIQRMQKGLLPAMRSLGYETDEEQLERLQTYQTELLQHEDKLKNLYQVSLSIESTRHDKNVEIEVSSEDTYTMTVYDDYETKDLPTTRQPDRSLVSGIMPFTPNLHNLPGKYYLQSYAEGNKAFSELAYINASRPTSVFDKSYYVRSKKNKATLKIKVHSTKLNKPQLIDKSIDLSGIPVIQVGNLTED